MSSSSILAAILLAFSPSKAPVAKARLQPPMADLAAIALPAPVAAADPLFAQMEGSWTGEGERSQLISGRRSRIEAQVDSQVVGDRLVSRNQIIETQLDSAGNPTGEPRTYQRVYWLRAKPDKPGFYDLGYGPGDNGSVTSEGELQGSGFDTEQEVGGGLVIRSQTEFTPDGSVYTETGWQDGTELSEAHIRYRRNGS